MTVATTVASRARLPRSATLGALVFLGGAYLTYWALTQSRGGRGLFDLGSSGNVKQWVDIGSAGKAPQNGAQAPQGGGGNKAVRR